MRRTNVKIAVCNFLSAIILRPFADSPLRVICDPDGGDSHNDILIKYNISDRGLDESARVEFVPPRKLTDGGTQEVVDYANTDGYTLKLHTARTPTWWSIEVEDAVSEDLKTRLRRMVVAEDAPYTTGCVIVADGVTVDSTYGRVIANYGQIITNYGRISYNYGSIDSNYGSIDSNCGSIGYNRGNINSNYGSLGYNYGSIESNCGSVDSNDGSIDSSNGKINYNYGRISYNYGSIGGIGEENRLHSTRNARPG